MRNPCTYYPVSQTSPLKYSATFLKIFTVIKNRVSLDQLLTQIHQNQLGDLYMVDGRHVMLI